ncbi:hypothetical protein BDY24DRAFT_400352 [Mrakia frigida]|uniref:uncharacterized protein n=1 Tax=Mrakia frigida TaxID=29902 RepID=UPI003FCBFA7C
MELLLRSRSRTSSRSSFPSPPSLRELGTDLLNLIFFSSGYSGDIILLTNGDVVPADARVLPGYISALETDEALLTGESLPVSKKVELLTEVECPVGDKKNMVFAGSQVTKGRARCIVVATGMGTELGKIAEAMERKEVVKLKGFAAKWYKFKVLAGVAGTTPLQVKLNTLAYILLGIALLLAFVVVASTAFVDVPMSIATYAVATAVSILPASLIAVVSLTLATASRELASKNALVRRMDAIESLSVVTDICSDKTGTITVGKMVVKKAWIPVSTAFPTQERAAQIDIVRGQAYSAESGSDPFYPRGIIRALTRSRLPGRSRTGDSRVTTLTNSSSDDDDEEDDVESEDVIRPSEMEDGLRNLVVCSSLCNMATLHKGKEDRWEAAGDATEIALQVFAHKLGHGKPHLTHPKKKAAANQTNPLSPVQTRTSEHGASKKVAMDGHYEIVVEHPFDSTVKRMSTVWKYESATEKRADMIVLMKGAVERILDRCAFIGLSPDTQVKLDEEGRQNIIARMDLLAGEGLRVLALASRVESREREAEIREMKRDDLEKNFCFLGLVGIYDPPRPQSRAAVLASKQAGLAVRMLTGDHPATAEAISLSVGILDAQAPKGAVMTGMQFDALSEEEIDALPALPLVVARCAPETKVRMVEAIHRRNINGMKCSSVMTGDGVNDCPALKRADIGFAMGQNGSDVAKGAADIVLADDNFATITRAIKKGRGVLMNLQKFLLFLLTGNIAEVLVLVIGLAFKDGDGYSVYPLNPVTALFINTIAAGPPALALGLEPTATDAMLKGPTAFRTIFTLWWWMDLVFYGVLMGGLTIANFVIVVFGSTVVGARGDLGFGCNEGDYDSRCENVFRGRATCFATLTLMIMLHAFECKHLERGLFQMQLLDNKILLWSSGICALSVFPIIYIPVISDYVFQLTGIGWEWGLVAAALVIYFCATEGWKLLRRMSTKGQNQGGPVVTEKNLPRFDTVAPGEKV